MKKILKNSIAIILCLMMVISFVGCNTGSTPPPSDDKSTLHIAANSKEMFVGETFDLNVVKKDAEGEIQTINQISYSTDNAIIASVEGGVITANSVGETYVNVTADGLDAACFVTVKAGVRGQVFEIRFTNENLYTGVPVQAFVYVTVDGKNEGIVENVTFTTEQTDVLSIDQSGVVTALEETESVTIKANGVYGGKTFEIEKDVAVVPPYVYSADRTKVTLASTKTYSGADNAKHTQTAIEVIRRDAVTGEETIVRGEDLTVKTQSPLFTSEIVGDKIVLTAAEDQIGSTGVYVEIDGVKQLGYFKVTVAHAIASIADMDKLAFASVNSPADLSSSFVMVDDIDYQGKAIYPIANFMEGSARVGYQWKYATYMDENKKYVPVSREDIGKEGIGLTDEEFIAFAKSKGVANGKKFTGVFDGNGYSIKNAALMYGASMFKSGEGYYSRDMAVFGSVENGAIQNLALTLTVQTPQNFKDAYSLDLNRIYDSSVDSTKVIDCVLNVNASSSKPNVNGAGLVARTDNCTVQNVILEIDYTSIVLSGSNLSATVIGGINGKNDKINVINCVINVTHGGTGGNVKYAISNLLSAGKIQNCLILNVNGVTTAINANRDDYGTNGVYYRDDTSWTKLYKMSIGEQASNGVSMADVIASFKSTLWDTSKCNATDGGAPQLKNGCSIPSAPATPAE